MSDNWDSWCAECFPEAQELHKEIKQLRAEVADLKEANEKLLALHYPQEYVALEKENKELLEENKKLRKEMWDRLAAIGDWLEDDAGGER